MATAVTEGNNHSLHGSVRVPDATLYWMYRISTYKKPCGMFCIFISKKQLLSLFQEGDSNVNKTFEPQLLAQMVVNID